MDVHALRRQYGALKLDEHALHPSPIKQCEIWLAEAISTEQQDPTAMVLSTVDDQGVPDARVVLLKEITDLGFVFYTHYLSVKGLQLQSHPDCALTFYWPVLARQIRIRGQASRLSVAQAQTYFSTRPFLSQLSALVSPQSQVIPNREILEKEISRMRATLPKEHISCPENWGGFLIQPSSIEFWQGRDNRLHDRVRYQFQAQSWQMFRLAP